MASLYWNNEIKSGKYYKLIFKFYIKINKKIIDGPGYEFNLINTNCKDIIGFIVLSNIDIHDNFGFKIKYNNWNYLLLSCFNYDIIININSVKDIKSGWEIK